MMLGWCCRRRRRSSFAIRVKDDIRTFLHDYDRLQYIAVILIYVQIGCALIGSLGALYNGVLLINLAISLFALVAIESSSQSLGRSYAVLLFCAILLDISWFILFAHEIWSVSSDSYGAPSRDPDFDLRNSFLSPVATPAAAAPRGSLGSDDAIGGSIYNPAYFSSLFEDGQENKSLLADQSDGFGEGGSSSAAEISQPKASIGRSSQAIDEENALAKPLKD